ncbi:myb-binding protein 1A-like protein [Colias croceus]|uniref:myb-binding protein 1A-like protein n=1 Tax=Colias crocea TaxID=72248 RepID=UPI001E27C445|nr:myb-binding protein 1A-like protein [Colias croceus]
MKDETVIEKPRKEVTTSLLEAFDSLKSDKHDVKITGGARIISRLQSNENDKDLQYSLKRIIRSLGANTPETRTGYFATLVSLLTKFPEITVSQLLELIKKELHASGSSKSEVGDVSLGQILVCGAIFRSGLMLKCTEEEQKQTIQMLIAASTKKSYLGTVASLILLDFVKEIDEDKFSNIVWSNIKANYKKAIKEHTLDSLHFLLVVSSKFPNKVKVRKLFGVPEILHEDHIADISEKLLEGIDYNSVNHPIYQEIGKQIAKTPHLLTFWNKIDSQLVKHNRNRELVAINILNNVLQNLEDNVEVIPDLISNKFFKLFLDWFKGLQTASKIRNKKDDEDDHRIMIKKEKELLNSLIKALKSKSVTSSLRVEILKKLLFNPGEINLTEITGTNIVKLIFTDLDTDGVKKMAKLFKKVLLNTSKKFVKEGVERNWYNNERVKAAEMISYLVSHEAVKDDTEFKISYMQILMCFGFFKISGDDNVAVGSDLAGSIKTCFYRCFTSRFTNVDNLVMVLTSLCHFITKIMEKDQVREKLEKQFTKENMGCWEMLMETCEKIEKIESKSKVDKVFLILLYQLGLFLFSEPTHVKVARSSIKELRDCFNHYTMGKVNESKKVNGDLEDSEPEWVEVMVEILLSILSIESSVLRSVVQCVFRLLWEYLTPSSIGQIVSVLDPDSAENPLTQDSDSEDEKDEDEKSEVENMETDEVKENGDNNSDSEGSDDSEDDDDNDEGDDDDENDLKNPDQLRIAVQKALGTAAAADDDAESINADDIDEEEGKKLDEALAEAFKQFHQGKNKKTKKERKNKKSLSDFRIRVLDLIDIYLEKDPSMDICLSMIAPLTRCLEFCMQDNQFSELENRLRKTIKTLSKVRKFASVEDITLDILCDYFKATIDKGARSHFLYQALGDVITNFATFIVHCSQKIGSPNKKSLKKIKPCPLTGILKETVNSFFTNRSCMLPIIFFHSILQTDWKGIYEIVPVITKNVFDKNVRQFRRNEGLELLIGFYRSLNRNKPSVNEVSGKIMDIEKDFENQLMAIKDDSEYIVKNNFITLLKKLINVIKSVHESCHIESKLDFQSLQSIVSGIKCAAKSNENNVQNQQSGKKIQKKKKKKRKNSQSNGDIEPEMKKSKKKVQNATPEL